MVTVFGSRSRTLVVGSSGQRIYSPTSLGGDGLIATCREAHFSEWSRWVSTARKRIGMCVCVRPEFRYYHPVVSSDESHSAIKSFVALSNPSTDFHTATQVSPRHRKNRPASQSKLVKERRRNGRDRSGFLVARRHQAVNMLACYDSINFSSRSTCRRAASEKGANKKEEKSVGIHQHVGTPRVTQFCQGRPELGFVEVNAIHRYFPFPWFLYRIPKDANRAVIFSPSRNKQTTNKHGSAASHEVLHRNPCLTHSGAHRR